jgi:hypothetical protein
VNISINTRKCIRLREFRDICILQIGDELIAMMPKSPHAVNTNYALLQTPQKLLRSCVPRIICLHDVADTETRGRSRVIAKRETSYLNTYLSTSIAILAFGDIGTN